jgi:5,6-dimethylbenzimidazole synthase
MFSFADADALTRILTWRRDVRRFRSDPVDEILIGALAAAMNLAPSVGNARPWRVLRIEDRNTRAAVQDHFAHCNADAVEAYAGDTREAYRQMVLAGFDTAPLQLAVFTVTDPVAGRGLGRRTMPETLVQSTAMAIHTLWLAARAHNLGLGMVSILQPPEVERICAVPPDWRFSAWLCLGHPETEDDTPLLHRNGWQANAGHAWERR